MLKKGYKKHLLVVTSWLVLTGLIFAIVGLLATIVAPGLAFADTQTQIAQFEPDSEYEGNATHAIYNKEIAAQTFTVLQTHDVSYIAIYGYLTGDPKYVQVQLRTGNGTDVATSVPTKNLVYHWFGTKSEATMSSDYFTGNESGSWVICQLAKTTKLDPGLYAIVVKSPSGDSENSFNWSYNDEGDPYSGGARVTSSNDGGSWTVQANDDFLFETWGESGLLIKSVNVYNSFYASGDWLIVMSYLNKAPTYYKEEDIEQYFRVRFTDNSTGNITGETVLRSWDAAITSIYLNSSQVSGIEWETGNFTLSIIATYGSGFEVEHNLVPAEFIGDTLSFLDKWCIAQAQWMGTMNYSNDMYYLRDTSIGLVLNEKGINKFDLGIPRLGTIRGEYIYETYMSEAELDPLGTPNPQLQNRFVWRTQLGEGLADLLDAFGAPFNLSGKTIGLIVMLILYVAIVGSSFPAGHSTAGASIGFAIILMGMIAGLVDVVWVILAAALAGGLGLRQLIIQGA